MSRVHGQIVGEGEDPIAQRPVHLAGQRLAVLVSQQVGPPSTKGAARIQTDLAEQPAVQATLMSTMGDAYHRLGSYKNARALKDQALFRVGPLEDMLRPERLSALYGRAVEVREEGGRRFVHPAAGGPP